MAMIIGSLLGSLASSLFGGGSKTGLKEVKGKRKLIVIHEGEMVLPARLSRKLRNDPDYKAEIARLPRKPQPLSMGDKKYIKKEMVRRSKI